MPENHENTLSEAHASEVEAGQRFRFGDNWARFLRLLSDDRIAEAEKSLREFLGLDSLAGLTFLDAGCGSGLFSLAARRLGARVHSLDFDRQAVHCAEELKRRFFPNDGSWTIEHASVLDRDHMAGLGGFDIVYSWGVLHHTGQMWNAIEYAAICVKPGGLFFIAIYNDQGRPSRTWLKIKQAYNRLPSAFRFLVLWPSFLRLWGPTILRDTLRLNPLKSWKEYGGVRGMSPWYDVVDWVGGLPFEVAKPEEIFDFCDARRFRLKRMRTCAGGLGCNEFLFEKTPGA
ncbi:MAG: class I SAM-dependent methyltransferase [Candidatus Sumerlaeaceae bacterium]|nr:class I SAM-dependent methyltransferase [Candidatus Sumerlaeaceae bacterium]